MDFQLFKKIAELPGVSGREEAVRAAILKLLKPLTDEIRVDNMGNIIAYKKGRGVRKLMLAAHMDEVGLMVSHIDDNGFLRFIKLGNIDARTLPGQRVIIQTAKGPLNGVVCTKPPHVLDAADAAKAPGIKNLFIDTALDAEAKNIISIGDRAGYDRTAVEFGSGHITSKTIDDRVGVYIILEALKKIKKFDCDIYAAVTVQEEVGLRGAVTAAYGIDPDAALVVDATRASDVPGVPPQEYGCCVGKGVAVTLMNAGTLVNPQMVNFLIKLAEENNIKYQLCVSEAGSNDAAVIHKTKSGVPTGILSLPTRYLHTSIETCSKADVDAAVDLTVAFIENCCKYNFDF
ncbi:MAG: M42 family metallopeptidase [Elusimicrobia bacterium]|nr:M42 family metallopeptidase [Elusimicrobiota bacterium]